MRRLALLFAGATLWLLLAALPALADGGVHVAVLNSGSSTLTSDTCAGCHRAHTAQGEFLIRAATEEALCLTCHGAASTGASADVMTGVQYALSGGLRAGTQIGALRNGGFDKARVDSTNPARITYLRTAVDLSFRSKVYALSTPVDVTSAHLALPENGLIAKDVAWGNGAAGSGAGPTVEIGCTSCHNPHGNGQYRILNTLPAATGTGFLDPVQIPISGVSATTDRFTTSQAHGFIVGDIVTIQGVTGAAPSFSTAAQYIIKSIPNGVTFTVAPATTKTSADITGTAVDFTTGGTGGTVQRYAAIVDDAPLPASGDERNYSILQVRGYQGSPSSYLLYASSVVSARGSSSFNLSADIVGLTALNERFTTGLAHGFAVGDFVTIGGGTPFDSLVPYTIASIPSSTTFTLTGVDVTANRTATGTGTISAVDAGTDTITAGAHSFVVGDAVQFVGGPAPLANGTTYYVILSATPTLRVSASLGGPLFDITGTTTGGTVRSIRFGTATKAVAGSFAATDGDYFHRTVPWNPKGVNSACPNDTFVGTDTALISACLTAQDAPNGRPATVTSTSTVNTFTVTPSAYGQIAFNDQISAWCSTCHSRYYSSSNPNPGTEPNSSTDLPRTVTAINLGTDTITVGDTVPPGATPITSTGFSVGDVVDFVATPTAPDLSTGTWYVVYASGLDFRVSSTYDGAPVDITGYSGGGTVVRLYPASAASWWFPRPGEDIYKYQHRTTDNRSCVTCHVSHGSDAPMPGTYSDPLTYPDGSAATAGNSRLLKIQNRGTCQMCHDPTGTSVPGTLLPAGPTPTVP